jgi:hypothetical protein
MYKILFLKNERNDATDYYVEIIKKTLTKSGNSVELIDEISLINKDDKVLTISLKAFFLVWLNNPRQFIIHWFQGVTPEEALMLFSSNKIQKKIRWSYLTLFEKFVLKYSKFNFFVSNRMHEHYKNKYNYYFKNYMLMPCYNQHLNVNAFYDEKYKKPSFVYAGSLAKWQCIDETLEIFKKINARIPESKMYILTSEQDKAIELIRKYSMENTFVDYVPYNLLNDRIKSFKYGFLIRDDTLVNEVATPTKMNGYLANGVIPIYSNIIDDFKNKLNGRFLIDVKGVDDAVDKIIMFELKKITKHEILAEYGSYFNEYYSDSFYVSVLEKKFIQFKVI